MLRKSRFAKPFATVVAYLCAAATGVSVVVIPPALSAQQVKPPTLRSRTDIVRIDIGVLDNRTGRPITDLTKDDFTVVENGTPQQIVLFVKDGPGVVPSDQAAAGEPAERDRPRVFLFLIGAGHLEGPIDPFEGAAQFARERLRPQDLVSVMAFNRIAEATRDHEQIASIIEKIKREQLKVRTDLLLLGRNNRGKKDITPAIQESIDNLFQLPGRRTPLRSVTTHLLGDRQFQADLRDQWRPWEAIVSHSDLLRIYAGIEFLRPFDAEKHLVSLVKGFGLGLPRFIRNVPDVMVFDDTRDDEALAARANDAGVALDIIHTWGVPAWASTRAESQALGQATTISSAETLASATGGTFTGVRTASEALARMDNASRNGYLLGYMPTNPSLDGTFRKIDVKVNRKNVTLVFRRGYTAQAEAPPVDPVAVLTRERLSEAAASSLPATDIKLQAKVSRIGKTSSGQPQIRVELTIDPDGLALSGSGGRLEGALDIVVLAGDDREQLVGRHQERMPLRLTPVMLELAKRTGLQFATDVPLQGQARFVKVIVYDFASDRLGTADVIVK